MIYSELVLVLCAECDIDSVGTCVFFWYEICLLLGYLPPLEVEHIALEHLKFCKLQTS